MKLLILLIPLLLAAQRALDPQPELLWPNGAPGAVGTEDADKPMLTAWLPAKSNGQAVVVCPGGGYGALAIDHEGKQIAQWLNSQGIAAFVLKYRLGMRYHHPAPLHDALEAMRTVRRRAASLGIDAKRVGIWGFSAGGHLASTVATHFDGPESRPDFVILGYPVISFMESVHRGSLRNLLGENPDPKLVGSSRMRLR